MMSGMKMSATIEDWELRRPFRIAGAEWLSSPTLLVEVEADGHRGRGEAKRWPRVSDRRWNSRWTEELGL